MRLRFIKFITLRSRVISCVLITVLCSCDQYTFYGSHSLPSQVDFNFHIKPIISDRCFKCHGPDNGTREADLFLHTQEGLYAALASDPSRHVIVPGDASSSEIIHRITSDDVDTRMPPEGSNLSLTNHEKALITRWIDQGAEWKPHWAFIPPEKSSLPKVKKRSWPRNEIDYFTLAKMEEVGLEPSEEASKEKLIRRASFDLTGLPPTLDEIDNFINDKSDNAYEKVVDRLLSSESFGERMASEWMDVARYSDTHGFQDDRPRTMWPWRDWVIDAFNKNLPYDKFITWQIGGDLLPDATYEQKLATGFNRNHSITQEGGVVQEEYRVEYVADRTHTTATAFLGITMECARCHNHKYDPFSQEEYYQTFAFFNKLDEKGMIDYHTEAPSPSIAVRSSSIKKRLNVLRSEIEKKEKHLQKLNDIYTSEFKTWVDDQQIKVFYEKTIKDRLIGSYDFDEKIRIDQDNKTSYYITNNDVKDGPIPTINESAAYGKTKNLSLPRIVNGIKKKAFEFDGNNFVSLGDVGDFDKNDQFSVSFWMKLKEPLEKKSYIFSKNELELSASRGHNLILTKSGALRFELIHLKKELSYNSETINDTIDFLIPEDLLQALEAEKYWALIDNKKKYVSALYIEKMQKGVIIDSNGNEVPAYVRLDVKEGGYETEEILSSINKSKNRKHRKYLIDEYAKQVKKSSASDMIRVTTKKSIEYNKWHHLAIIYDGSNLARGIKLYLDGQFQDLNHDFDNLTRKTLNGVNLFFGNWSNLSPDRTSPDNMGFANGSIDELKVYNRQLTLLEVSTLAKLTSLESYTENSYSELSNDIKSKLNEYYRYHFDAEYNKYLDELIFFRKKNFIMPYVMIMEDIDDLRDTYVLTRGMYDAPTKQVSAGTPEAILPFPDDYPRNRLGLAWWLTDSKNPLTARVTVNRYWQVIFGQGIVSTPDDFGSQGSLPTHPQLLDWLAVDFMETDWDLKELLKKMVMSSTYMQSSRIEPGSLKKDYDNTYYGRSSNKRLTAEMIRDHVLAISGLLNREIGGPPVKPYQPPGVWQAVANTIGEYKYRQSLGNLVHRKSLYTYWKRTIPPPSMVTLDASMRDKCTVKREATNTPLQAMILLNDPQYVEASRILAERMLKEGGLDVEDRIIFAFKLATSRKPNAVELGELIDLYDQQIQYYSQTPEASMELFSIGDSPVDRDIDNIKLAASTIIASTIINLDETVRKG